MVMTLQITITQNPLIYSIFTNLVNLYFSNIDIIPYALETYLFIEHNIILTTCGYHSRIFEFNSTEDYFLFLIKYS